MRLLNASTLLVENFRDHNAPPYVTLSHRWGEDELRYEHVETKQNLARAFHKGGAGIAKVKALCQLALKNNYSHVWVDTCCIDKRSSAELSESINSMYRWYSRSACCYAYLSDVGKEHRDFDKSEWFFRGWTLQELIAPSKVEFYDRDWNHIGSKSSRLSQLAAITRISKDVLRGAADPSRCSVAQRMSWAAHRVTERPEDRAYSLVGLFKIRLNAIYGIGEEQAFLQLQEEIIKKHNDQTIFAWGFGNHHSNLDPEPLRGLLASSPTAFAGCQDIVAHKTHQSDHWKVKHPSEFSIGQNGLSIHLLTIPYCMDTYIGMINCTNASRPDSVCGILLERLDSRNQYARVCKRRPRPLLIKCAEALSHKHRKVRQIRVQQHVQGHANNIPYGFRIGSLDLPGFTREDLATIKIWSRERRRVDDPDIKRVIIPHGASGTAGIISVGPEASESHCHGVHWIKVGFDLDFNPMLIIGSMNSRWGDDELSLARSAASLDHCLHSSQEARDRLFNDEWLFEVAEAPEQARKWDSVCILRGESYYNSFEIPALNLRIDLDLEECLSSAECGQQYPNSAPRVWTLNIDRITQSDDHLDLVKKRRVYKGGGHSAGIHKTRRGQKIVSTVLIASTLLRALSRA